MSGLRLRKFLLRYYPPGIILQYEREGQMKQKPVDLLDLVPGVDVEVRARSVACMHACACSADVWHNRGAGSEVGG